MALFTDKSPADTEMLRGYESSILELAQTERIGIEEKLYLTQLEIGDRIVSFLLRQATGDDQTTRRRIGVRGVVITPALQRWHAFLTLDAIYRDAYGSQLNERYAAKAAEYRATADRAAVEYFQLGVGLVSIPVPIGVPPSTPEPANGTPLYYARMTLVDERGVEGAPCRTVILSLAQGTPVYGPSGFLESPPRWNLYLGTTREKLSLQNASPLGPMEDWIFPGWVAGGRAPGNGQEPDYYVVWQQMQLRG